jgi:serine phosphatase RsbU (regulator of sigma subunit)
MIGLAPGERRQASSVTIPPGTLLCFYTDGLIERPRELLDDSLARLCQAVRAEPLETAITAVMATMVGNRAARDDIALLMLRRQPPGGGHAA